MSDIKYRPPYFIKIVLILMYWTGLSAQEQPVSPLVASFEEHREMKANSTYQLEWISLGPTLNGARVEAVQADPSNPGTIYVAFGSGGLWKTTDNGLSWRSIFDNMPSLGIGDIALASSNPEVIYLGTGESLKKARNFTMPGVGMYRSDDGGQTWQHLGLNDAWHIGEISVHPEDPDIVLVAVQGHFWTSNENRGIYRTEDGGRSWEHVLYLDETVGANDIVFSPADPTMAYASMWENYPSVQGAKGGVYTTNDMGKTWERRVEGIVINSNTGRIGIAASYQEPNKAYAFVDQRNRGRNQGAGELYKTLDGGLTWTMTHDEPLHSLSVIGWYFMDTYVNPKDDEEVYALGVRLAHSRDGGKRFSYIGGQIRHLTPSVAQTLHLDHCEMWINPLNPDELLLGNDGGLFHSYDNGNSWLHLNNIPTGEFYDIEIDQSEPYTIYGGTQDDATVVGHAVERIPHLNDTWEYLWIDAWSGGDGCITLVDPNDENTLYFSMQNGAARRMDLRYDTSVSIMPRFPRDSISLEYNFITPYFLSPHNSDRVYMAGNYVLRSENRGDSWDVISPMIVDSSHTTFPEIAAGAMAESHFTEGVLYVGTDRGNMWVSEDGGATWDNRSEGLSSNYIRSIHPSVHKEGRVYIQQTGLNYDDFGAYLYVSEDQGRQWTSIVGNLPDHPINSILEDPYHENILYAGTYRGVYISVDKGRNWTYLGKGMRDTSIGDLSIHFESRDLVVATHGSGIYKMNLSPIHQLMDSSYTESVLLAIPSISAPRYRDTHGDVELSSLQRLPISFWLDMDQEVLLELSTTQDSVIWKHQMSGQKGYNQYRWDLVLEREKSMSPYHIHYHKYAKPGIYNLTISSDSFTDSSQLIILQSDK